MGEMPGEAFFHPSLGRETVVFVPLRVHRDKGND
jgi:hypothetical protein